MSKGTIHVTIDGTSYPCRMTMGAMLRFKRETGREVSEITEGSISDVAVLLWCCVTSACKADGIPFTMSLEDFCDNVSTEDMDAMSDAISEEGKEDTDPKKA